MNGKCKRCGNEMNGKTCEHCLKEEAKERGRIAWRRLSFSALIRKDDELTEKYKDAGKPC